MQHSPGACAACSQLLRHRQDHEMILDLQLTTPLELRAWQCTCRSSGWGNAFCAGTSSNGALSTSSPQELFFKVNTNALCFNLALQSAPLESALAAVVRRALVQAPRGLPRL